MTVVAMPGIEGALRARAVDAVHAATAFYTTESVVDSVLDMVAWPRPKGRLLDTSAGDGAFLVRAMQRLAPRPGDFAEAQRICGYEFHPAAAADARANLASCLMELGWSAVDARNAADAIVVERDFLLQGPAHGIFDVIVGNPPYLKFSRLPAYFKEIYSAQLAKHAIGDILYAFLDKCADVMAPFGMVGLVTADRWLFNETAARLRVELGKRVGLSHVSRLDCSTSFYRPKHRVAGSLPRVHPVQVLFQPANVARVPLTAAPISPDGYDLEPHQGPTLQDVAKIRLAPWLGPHGIFVVDNGTAASLPGADLVRAVDTDDIDPNTDVLGEPQRFAIRTDPKVEPAGAVGEHLRANHHRMPPRGCKGPYWVPPERIKAPTDLPSLLVPRIARRFRPVHLAPGYLAINHNLSVVSSGGLLSLEQIGRVLASRESHDWLVRHAPRLEAQFFSITTKLLRRVPVPAELLPAALQEAA